MVKPLKKELKWQITLSEKTNDEALPSKSIQSFTCHPKKFKFIIFWVILTVQECLLLYSKYKSLLFSTFYSFKLIITLSEFLLYSCL